ncbi:MAG: HIT family protein [Candidatus Nomurabacteria bacterium]|jgi:histidine triad (HIT) family protein|nr:HIT family protein [Candidatus Nomurabacteria bacterium]
MEDSVFTKIIRGDIPSHKIYEDDKVFAFLDIHPETAGHTLVVPKIQVDKIYDLPDDYYSAMWSAAKTIAQNMEKVLGKRVRLSVVGVDVPHAHIHVLTIDPAKIGTPPPLANNEDLAKIAEKLLLK